MFCQHCGVELPNTTEFCSSCGNGVPHITPNHVEAGPIEGRREPRLKDTQSIGSRLFQLVVWIALFLLVSFTLRAFFITVWAINDYLGTPVALMAAIFITTWFFHWMSGDSNQE